MILEILEYGNVVCNHRSTLYTIL